MVFQLYYSWIETTLRKKILGSKPNHMFISGLTQSGKTYLFSWFGEQVVEKGVSKLIIMNCNKRFMLEEQLMYLFPNTNKDDMKKIMKTKTREHGKLVTSLPKGFKVKVYVPISSHCPDELPENFIPFSIAVNDWDESVLQILYGDKDVTRIKGIYDTQIKHTRSKKKGYSDLKNVLRKFKNATTLSQRGFMGTQVTYFTPKAQRKTIEGFFGRLQQFNEQGILANAKFPHNLKDLLKKELKDQKTIVILNTEYLDNVMLEYFVFAYFCKTVTELLDKDGLKHKINHKIVLWFDEIRFLFPSTSEHKKTVHIGMSDLGATLLTTGRHSLIEIWLSVQSPSFIPASFLKNIGTKIITNFKEKDDKDWVSEYLYDYSKEHIRDIFSAFERQRNKGDYRFLILEEKIERVTLQSTSKTGWGNKLPRPRLSFYYTRTKENKIPLDNFKILDKDPYTKIDLGIKTVQTMGDAKRLLRDEFEQGETKLRELIVREKTERQRRLAMEKRKIEEEENRKIKRVSEIANLIGENYSQISAHAGISRDEARLYIGRAREFGLIDLNETIEKRKELIKRINSGKDYKKLGFDEFQIKSLVEKAKKYHLIQRTINFSSDDKVVENAKSSQ